MIDLAQHSGDPHRASTPLVPCLVTPANVSFNAEILVTMLALVWDSR